MPETPTGGAAEQRRSMERAREPRRVAPPCPRELVCRPDAITETSSPPAENEPGSTNGVPSALERRASVWVDSGDTPPLAMPTYLTRPAITASLAWTARRGVGCARTGVARASGQGYRAMCILQVSARGCGLGHRRHHGSRRCAERDVREGLDR